MLGRLLSLMIGALHCKILPVTACSAVTIILACYLINNSPLLASTNNIRFNGTVPFNCAFTGGSDMVEMEFTRNGSYGVMLGTADVLTIQSNMIPNLHVELNTILAPQPISFRGIWIRSVATNRYIRYKTSSSYSNDPVDMTISSSLLEDNEFVKDRPYDIKIQVSANLPWAYPNQLYSWQAILTCLSP